MDQDAFRNQDEEAGVTTWEARFIDSATAAGDALRVVIDGYDNGRGDFGPVVWQPHAGNAYPQAGDTAIVSQSDKGRWWVLEWAGSGAADVFKQVLSLTAGWTAFGSGTEVPTYSRLGRLVVLQGLVTKTGGTPAPGDIIGTLPAGFRPAGVLHFAVYTGDPAAAGGVFISADGTIRWFFGNTGVTDFTSLGGVSFVID